MAPKSLGSRWGVRTNAEIEVSLASVPETKPITMWSVFRGLPCGNATAWLGSGAGLAEEGQVTLSVHPLREATRPQDRRSSTLETVQEPRGQAARPQRQSRPRSDRDGAVLQGARRSPRARIQAKMLPRGPLHPCTGTEVTTAPDQAMRDQRSTVCREARPPPQSSLPGGEQPKCPARSPVLDGLGVWCGGAS